MQYRRADVQLMSRALAQSATFSVAQHHGIWRVTLDGVFFGDYRSKQNALEGLRDKSTALEKVGAAVKVLTPGDATQDETR